MNEFTNRRAGQAKTVQGIVPPVTLQEFADFLGVNVSDPLLPGILASASESVVGFIGRDLINRTWTLTHWDWPVWGTLAARNVGRPTGDYRREINLPYAGLQSVELVELYGDPTTDFVTRDDAIVLRGIGLSGGNDDPAIVVEYVAGFGDDAGDVPESIKGAILALAAFNYEHRGTCDAHQAMKRSGAADMLAQWRKAELLW